MSITLINEARKSVIENAIKEVKGVYDFKFTSGVNSKTFSFTYRREVIRGKILPVSVLFGKRESYGIEYYKSLLHTDIKYNKEIEYFLDDLVKIFRK